MVELVKIEVELTEDMVEVMKPLSKQIIGEEDVAEFISYIVEYHMSHEYPGALLAKALGNKGDD